MASPSVVYARQTAVFRTRAGASLVIRLGERFAADDQAVIERPDLFTRDDPGLRRSTPAPVHPRRRCWTCRAWYEVTQSSQRYCGAKCRRARERWLTRTCRLVLKGSRGDPRDPGPTATVPEVNRWLADLSTRISEFERLSAILCGRADPVDPAYPAADEVPVPVRTSAAEFGAVIAGEIRRLCEVRDRAQEQFTDAEHQADLTRAGLVGADFIGPMSVPARAHRRRLELWEQELGGSDD